MIHLPVRFRTSSAKSAIAGLLAISLSASAGMVAAAPAAVSPLSLGTGGVVSPTPSSAALAPVSDRTTVVPQDLVPKSTVAPPARHQVAAQVKTAIVTTKRKSAPRKPAVAPRKVAVSYHGVYHLWIPALSLSRGISDWGCNGGLIPNRVEYWGCVGRNNLYLLGHAWGVFAEIHDGYHSGALHAGLAAWYADKAGRVHRYRVSWVRHVRNADYASWSQWAMAATSDSVITLQTCDGATSAYRILVRLVPA